MLNFSYLVELSHEGVFLLIDLLYITYHYISWMVIGIALAVCHIVDP